MNDILLFVHGTGVRDIALPMEQIRAGVSKHLGWEAGQVVGVEWGRKVGPQDLDIGPALPPEDATRGLGAAQPSADEEIAALWEVLLADPHVEIRLMAPDEPEQPGFRDPKPEPKPAGDQARDNVMNLTVPVEILRPAGLDEEDLAAAKTAIAEDPALDRAATAAGHAADVELAAALGRALVATMLRPRIAAAESIEGLPAAAVDARVRDELVAEITRRLAPEGVRGAFFKKQLMGFVTRIAVSKRAALMDPFSDFLRDVAFYVQHGEDVRDYLAQAIRDNATDGRMVVLAHSLGAIAVVDLLSEPTTVPNALKVDLLVTVGSQAPLLYLLDALSSMRPSEPEKARPFEPWLNVYNRQDLLSFCAKRVFVNSTGITDEPIAAGVPFPMSHGAYWTQDRLYELLRAHLP